MTTRDQEAGAHPHEEAAETTTAALSAVSKLLAEADMKLGSQHEAALRRAMPTEISWW